MRCVMRAPERAEGPGIRAADAWGLSPEARGPLVEAHVARRVERERRRRTGERVAEGRQVAALLELQDGLTLQLANPFAAQVELAPELLQRAGRPAVDAVADPQNFL